LISYANWWAPGTFSGRLCSKKTNQRLAHAAGLAAAIDRDWPFDGMERRLEAPTSGAGLDFGGNFSLVVELVGGGQ
jgi:hypothetical protein